tara:strand:+ start:320 stop:640 length:321 start_codon:yes stop_codon:yes gene_type:complete
MYIYQGKEYETLDDLWDAAQLAVELKAKSDNSYNCWTNRETWLVNIWFMDYLHEELKDYDYVASDRAHYIKDYVEEYIDNSDIPDSFINDLIDISRVNWHELAEKT